MRKGEIACYKPCFLQPYILVRQNVALYGNGLRTKIVLPNLSWAEFEINRTCYGPKISVMSPKKNNTFLNIVREEKMLVTNLFSFSHNLFCLLTLSQTSPDFYVSAVLVFGKHCGKRRNCS